MHSKKDTTKKRLFCGDFYLTLNLILLKPQFYYDTVMLNTHVSNGYLQLQMLQAIIKSKQVRVLTNGTETWVANRSCNSR